MDYLASEKRVFCVIDKKYFDVLKSRPSERTRLGSGRRQVVDIERQTVMNPVNNSPTRNANKINKRTRPLKARTSHRHFGAGIPS